MEGRAWSLGDRRCSYNVIVVAAALCTRAAQAEIRIGVAGPVTGPWAWFGEQYQRGTGLAVEDLNAADGVLRRSVELIGGDEQSGEPREVGQAVHAAA